MDTQFFKRALSFSVGAHFFALLLVIMFAQRINPESLKMVQPEVVWLDPDVIQEKQNPKHQVVQSEKGHKVDKARDDAYLGRENRIVEKETVARMQRSGSASSQKSQASQTKQVQVVPTEKAPALSELGVKMFRKPASVPVQDTPQWQDFGSDYGVAAQDHVKGLKETEATALNTREFIYFSYFQRIRDQLERAWRPLLQEQLSRLFRSGRNPASDMEHVTRTVVFLDSKGEVIRVQVIEESGTRDLDDAAIRAFNQAGPFPNPPRGLVEESGQVRIQWQFVLRT